MLVKGINEMITQSKYCIAFFFLNKNVKGITVIKKHWPVPLSYPFVNHIKNVIGQFT